MHNKPEREMNQLLITGGSCVIQDSIVEADILVDEGKIVDINRHIDSNAITTIDASGLVILPGGIDVHVHLPWPTGNYISTDTFYSGTKAAAFGGVTTIIDFVIPMDNETLNEALLRKLSDAKENAWVDYSFHLNIRGEIANKIKEIEQLVKMGFPSFKVFMAYEGFRLPDNELLLVMEAIKKAGGMINVHAENGHLADFLTQNLIGEGNLSPNNYSKARPNICETEAISRLLGYERMTGVRLHIHHVSTRKGAELIRDARIEGYPITAETCPHYLLLNDTEYQHGDEFAAYMICAPSIKSKKDQSGLWDYLADGSIPIIATDHCPYTRQQKEEHLENFSLIPGGIGGVELRLPLIYTYGVLQQKISLSRFVQSWATEPAKAFGLYPRKGVIAIGSDADFVIMDPSQKGLINSKELHMNTDCLPYEGWEISGTRTTTILNGEVIVKNGKLINDKPEGMLVPRYLIPTTL
jgi:dihydropyrimidinase